MRTIFVVTVGRSDFGIFRPVLDRIASEPGLDYSLIVSGGHLAEGTKGTASEIAAENRPVVARISLPDTQDGQLAMADAMGAMLTGCAALFARSRPDILLVLGDRFEMFAAAAAAVPFNIPIAHIHGGELSFGAIDEVFRHAMTKMAHLHFAATQEYAERITRMGEEPWRVTVSGAPGLDSALNAELPDKLTLSARFSIPLDAAPILVAFHPVTRQAGEESTQVAALLDALARTDRPIVFTAPNADGGSGVIRASIERFVAQRPRTFLVENFGSLNFLAMLRESAAMVGNSSSGLIESPSFRLPTVNIGDRQEGRSRARNVIDVPVSADAIWRGIETALDPAFRAGLADLASPYGDGHAAERIVDVLRNVELGQKLISKRFHDGRGS